MRRVLRLLHQERAQKTFLQTKKKYGFLSLFHVVL